MCVAIAVTGGIAAGGAIASAKIQSNAAKKAAATQAASATEARNVQQTQYQQARQDFNPYQQAGAAALGRLGQQASAPRITFDPNAPKSSQGMPVQTPLGAYAQSHAPQAGMGAGAPNMAAMGQGGGPGPSALQGQAGPLWTVQGPDGSTKQLPADVAQQFIARGAKRVG